MLDDGAVLTENIAVLDWLAAQSPDLAPAEPFDRSRMPEALAYVGTELHHGFAPLWHAGSDAEAQNARQTLAAKLQYVASALSGDYWLGGDSPCVADFYLFVMLLWAARFAVPTPAALEALRSRMAARPAVQRALREEGLLAPAQA